MAASCVWKPCKTSGQEDAVIVKFSNGCVKRDDRLDFQLLKHVDGANPRKKNRRIVVAESDRLCYVGNSFDSSSLQCNNLCKYFVGVLDKKTMKMKVQSAQLFNLQPVIPGEAVTNTEPKEAKTYREKVDSLIEAFGTTKQKRALSSRRLNEVGNDTLQKAVARAASSIIDHKGLEALQQEVADSQAQTELVLFLPPCNREADQPEDVYPFDDLLSPFEFEALKQVGDKLAALPPEDLPKMKDVCRAETVLLHLRNLPKDGEARGRRARCVWYLAFLLNLAQRKRLHRKLGEDECPRIVLNKVQKSFTVDSYVDGRLKSTIPLSMMAKLASHCLALLLHVDDQTADLTLLHRDLAISETKMLEVAKAMGLTLTRRPVFSTEESGEQAEHRMATLQLPLVKYERRVENRKRKKMS